MSSLTKAMGRAAIIVLAVLAVYWSSLDNEALTVGFDDNLYVTDNPLIRELSWKNLCQIFTQFYAVDYLPLFLLSLMIDYHFWGLDLLGYHLTNLVLHILNALLLWHLFCQLTKNEHDEPVAFTAALLFALHPVQVETVAWISQRNHLLSAFFFLWTFLAFIQYRTGSNRRYQWYIAALASFVCALLSKSGVVILPLLLLLYEGSFSAPVRLTDKIPFFVLAATFSIITALSRNSMGAIYPHHGGSLWMTTLVMQRVFFDYLGSLLLPLNLAPAYQYHWSAVLTPLSFFTVSLWMIMIAAAVIFRTKAPLLFFSLLWFLIALLPVANLVPISFLRADRYLYIPAMPLFLLGSCALKTLSSRLLSGQQKGAARSPIPLYRLLSTMLIAGYAFATVAYNPVWQNNLTVMSRVVEVDPKNAAAHTHLGALYIERGRLNEAVYHYRLALLLQPQNAEACYWLGAIYFDKRVFPLAEKYLRKAVELNKNNADAHFILGMIRQHEER